MNIDRSVRKIIKNKIKWIKEKKISQINDTKNSVAIITIQITKNRKLVFRSSDKTSKIVGNGLKEHSKMPETQNQQKNPQKDFFFLHFSDERDKPKLKYRNIKRKNPNPNAINEEKFPKQKKKKR